MSLSVPNTSTLTHTNTDTQQKFGGSLEDGRTLSSHSHFHYQTPRRSPGNSLKRKRSVNSRGSRTSLKSNLEDEENILQQLLTEWVSMLNADNLFPLTIMINFFFVRFFCLREVFTFIDFFLVPWNIFVLFWNISSHPLMSVSSNIIESLIVSQKYLFYRLWFLFIILCKYP